MPWIRLGGHSKFGKTRMYHEKGIWPGDERREALKIAMVRCEATREIRVDCGLDSRAPTTLGDFCH